MPKIKTAKKGPKATWRKRVRKAPTIIHIDGPTLRRNSRKHETEPVILVRQGSRCPTSCHEVDVKGPCRLVYRPNQPLSSGGATLWIEVEPNTNVTTKLFS